MSDPPPGQAFTKRLWPKRVEIPAGWQLSEEVTRLVADKYPDFVVIYGWFDSTWNEGKGTGASGLSWE